MEPLTRIELEHRDFQRHGDGALEYREALASTRGWSWILNRYVAVACPR